MKRNVMKFFSTVLVVTMLFTCMVFHASATADQYFMISSGKGARGDVVSLTVKLSNVKNLKGVQGTVNYDKNALYLEEKDIKIVSDGETDGNPDGVEKGISFSTLVWSINIYNDQGRVNFLGARQDPYPETETAQPIIVTLNFTIKAAAADGDYPITITDAKASKLAGVLETLGDSQNGTITVEGDSGQPAEATPAPTSTSGTGYTYTPLPIPEPTPTPTAAPTATKTPTPTSVAAATPTPVPVPSGKPKDMAEVSWATEYIADVIDRGIMKGYVEADGSTTFKPAGTATRAEFATALFNYLGYSKDGTASFADTQDHWAKDYIAKMVKEGIMSGYNDTQFGPNDPVTREQMATILDRAFKPKAAFDNFPYTDNSEISSWAEESVYAVQSVGWMSGDAAGTFRPTATATRAEIATIFSRLAKANVK